MLTRLSLYKNALKTGFRLTSLPSQRFALFKRSSLGLDLKNPSKFVSFFSTSSNEDNKKKPKDDSEKPETSSDNHEEKLSEGTNNSFNSSGKTKNAGKSQQHSSESTTSSSEQSGSEEDADLVKVTKNDNSTEANSNQQKPQKKTNRKRADRKKVPSDSNKDAKPASTGEEQVLGNNEGTDTQKNAATTEGATTAGEEGIAAASNVNIGNPEGDKKNSNTRLKTVPMKSMKLELTEEEKQLPEETFVLFSSSNPIIPFVKINGVFRTGNLSKDDLVYPIAYFLLNDQGDIYTIGVLLEKSVTTTVKKAMESVIEGPGKDETSSANSNQHMLDSKKLAKPGSQQYNAEIFTRKKNFRVKLTEIEVRDNGVFGKAIRLEDKETKEEKLLNLENEWNSMRNCIANIKRSVSYEKIEVFEDIDTAKMTINNKMKVNDIDEILYKIVSGIGKISQYTNDNWNVFFQSILECPSVVSRVLLVRRKLETLNSILEIVNNNFKLADENMLRLHTSAKARMSIDYIKYHYLQERREASAWGKQASGGDGQSSAAGQEGRATNQAQKYLDQLDKIKDEVSRDRIRKEIERFAAMDKHNSDYSKMYTYLDEIFSIPWDKYTKPFWEIPFAKKVLDQEIFGLEKVKERIIEMMAVNKLKSQDINARGFVILLYGPPGTGKTSIAKAIAKSIKRESRFISFAGVADPYFIKGHRRTYVDSQPGVFIKELIKAQTMNPVFILDEIDKLSRGNHGADPYYSLLEILNPEENSNFTDHYLDIKVDFSKAIFILTANQVLHMLEPLKNRLEIIDIPCYIEEEKVQIAKQYLIPKIYKDHGFEKEAIKIDDQTIYQIIKGWCLYEGGVRELGRCFEKIARKYAVEVLNKIPENQENPDEYPLLKELEIQNSDSKASKADETQTKKEEPAIPRQQILKPGMNFIPKTDLNNPPSASGDNKKKTEEEDSKPVRTTASEQVLQPRMFKIPEYIKRLDFTEPGVDSLQLLKKYLGSPYFDFDLELRSKKKFSIGVTNVLTVSDFLGHVLTVECVYDLTRPENKGQLYSSGNLKTVLQESLNIAKLNVYKYLTEEQINSVKNQNIHVHFMQAATPKDGPSAGISITTAILSLILNKPIPADWGMTGEISPNGEVCKIGGVQSKIIASKSLGIGKIILPYSNKGDVAELPKMLLQGLTIYLVEHYDQIFKLLFKDEENQKEILIVKEGNVESLLASYKPVEFPHSTIS